MSEIFQQLESNNKAEVEAVRQKIIEQFSTVKDSWLVNGLYDYYLSTNSANTIVVLVNIKEPHHLFLFDRLSDSILKSPKTDVKVQALTLLGHIVRNQPTWLYRLSEHHLLKDILKVLREEVEVLPLISALLILIVLIPMIPKSMGDVLVTIFEIFSRLASWNCSPGNSAEDQMIHMQVALYALFLRLYGMFPCNFLAYLRTHYKDKNKAVFNHTIKPMLEQVKMNPSLVTTSKDSEISNERWRKMEVHDVIVECESFSLDVSDNFCAHDTCQLASGFRSRSGTANSSIVDTAYLQSLKNLAASMSSEKGEYFSPSMSINAMSPPVGAVTIVSIPTYVPQTEFTHDDTVIPPAGSSPPEAAIEATPETTPVIQEESQYTQPRLKSLTTSSQPQSPVRKEKSPFSFPEVTDKTVSKAKTSSPISAQKIQIEWSPSKSSSSIDPEVYFDQRRSDVTQPTLKQSDSVLHESEDSASEIVEDDDRSSPCSAGGLHMPNSKSMKDFARRVQRLRHHSQCQSETHETSTTPIGSSPEADGGGSGKVRRANSCPEMKKSPAGSYKDTTKGDEGSVVLEEGDLWDQETQTDNFWPMPYEHLFLGIFPSLGTTEGGIGAGIGGVAMQQPSINDVLDRYLEAAIQDNGKDNIKGLKNQLKLVHQQLLFERHRREIHAFKNRRFLADAKNTQVLEEHNSALRDQVQLHQADIDALRKQLEQIQREKEIDTRQLTKTVAALEEKVKSLEYQNKDVQVRQEECCQEIDNWRGRYRDLIVEKQKVESMLIDALAEMKFAKEQAAAGEKGRAELEHVNRQLLLIGELQIKYKERLDEISMLRRSDRELELFKEAATNELKTLQHRYREKLIKLDAFATKIADLEQTVRQNDETIALQKRTLIGVNEETEEKIKVLESKYKTQLSICSSYEEKFLDLYRQLDTANRKPLRSPDTSSCQEVQVSSSDRASAGVSAAGAAAGGPFSQRSSPLSCSLTSSSESSLATGGSKGLQALVDEEPAAGGGDESPGEGPSKR